MIKLSWWSLLTRGLLAVLFGALAIAWPGITLAVLVLIFGAYALVDGILTGAAALAHRRSDPTWWLFLVGGLAGIAVGVLTFFVPGLTALVLVYLIAVRALILGLVEIVYAIALRREIPDEWFYIINGVLSILFGVILFIYPGTGALALITVIGAFAILIGIVLVIVAFRMRRLARLLFQARGVNDGTPGQIS